MHQVSRYKEEIRSPYLPVFLVRVNYDQQKLENYLEPPKIERPPHPSRNYHPNQKNNNNSQRNRNNKNGNRIYNKYKNNNNKNNTNNKNNNNNNNNKKSTEEDSPLECKICYDRVISISLPCGHAFCKQCLDLFPNICQICNAPFLPSEIRKLFI